MKHIFSLLLLTLAPTLTFAQETLHLDSTKAIQIEYSLVIPHYDSLVDYSSLPYTKVLTVKEGEAIVDVMYTDTTRNFLSYFNGVSGNVYQELSFHKGHFLKNKWVCGGEVVAESKNAAHKIMGLPCKAYQIGFEGEDTILVYSTDTFGLDFWEYGKIRGLPLEYEMPTRGFGKLKYRAVDIDVLWLKECHLADTASLKVVRMIPPSRLQLKRMRKKQDYRGYVTKKMEGKKAPHFTAKTMEGEKISSKKLKGKILVLNFWFTRCTPCVKEMPNLNKAQTYFKNDKDVVFLSFCLDDEKKIGRLLKDHPFQYKICPEARDIANRFRIQGYPANVIVDRQGKIAAYIRGNQGDIARQLVTAIEQAKRE